MALIRKNWQSQASGNATRALCRIAGAGVTAYALEKLTSNADTNASTTIKNISGPAAMIVGVMGDLMFDDDKLRALCQGVYTFGALKAVAVIAPSIGEPLGLNGLSGAAPEAITIGEATTETSTTDTPEEILAIEQGASNDGNDWSAVADYIEQDADSAVQESTTSGIEAAAVNMI